MLLKGIVIGFAIAAPIGPIGILCMSRTLSGGFLSGLITGAGAACADLIYASAAASGLASIALLFTSWNRFIQISGALFLLFLGLKTYFSKPDDVFRNAEKGNNLYFDFSSTFILTMINPMTILSFTGIFAGFGISGKNYCWINSISMITGVFIGSFAWWLLLSGIVCRLHKKLNLFAAIWINRAAGTIILLFAFWMILKEIR